MEMHPDPDLERVEIVPVVMVSQSFPARPSSIPDIRDFVRKCLAQSPLSEEDNKAIGETMSQALLEAAGPTGTIQVSFRIYPDHAEVDVLRSHPTLGAAASVESLAPFLCGAAVEPANGGGAESDDDAPTFAD